MNPTEPAKRFHSIERWEIDDSHILGRVKGVVHVINDVQRLSYSNWLIHTLCNRPVDDLICIRRTTVFYLRRTKRQRFCRACAATLRKEHRAAHPDAPSVPLRLLVSK